MEMPPLPADPVVQQQLLQCATAEEYTLQAARSAAITESSTRANMLLMSISGVLIALGFVGQASQLGATFHILAGVLFACLVLLGLATFIRVLESGIEESICVRGLNRIRRLYVGVTPAIAPYLVLGPSDDIAAIDRTIAVVTGRHEIFVTTAGTVAAVTGICAGVAVAVAINAAGGGVLGSLLAGGAAAVLLIVVLMMMQLRAWRSAAWRDHDG